MPNFERGKKDPDDDLEIASRVMDTVQKQIGSYRMSLEKLRLLRKEIQVDDELRKRVLSTPDDMAQVLTDRGIPEFLAVSMAAEDFQDRAFGGRLALWTWDCCCTGCCLTECNCTLITSIG